MSSNGSESDFSNVREGIEPHQPTGISNQQPEAAADSPSRHNQNTNPHFVYRNSGNLDQDAPADSRYPPRPLQSGPFRTTALMDAGAQQPVPGNAGGNGRNMNEHPQQSHRYARGPEDQQLRPFLPPPSSAASGHQQSYQPPSFSNVGYPDHSRLAGHHQQADPLSHLNPFLPLYSLPHQNSLFQIPRTAQPFEGENNHRAKAHPEQQFSPPPILHSVNPSAVAVANTRSPSIFHPSGSHQREQPERYNPTSSPQPLAQRQSGNPFSGRAVRSLPPNTSQQSRPRQESQSAGLDLGISTISISSQSTRYQSQSQSQALPLAPPAENTFPIGRAVVLPFITNNRSSDISQLPSKQANPVASGGNPFAAGRASTIRPLIMSAEVSITPQVEQPALPEIEQVTSQVEDLELPEADQPPIRQVVENKAKEKDKERATGTPQPSRRGQYLLPNPRSLETLTLSSSSPSDISYRHLNLGPETSPPPSETHSNTTATAITTILRGPLSGYFDRRRLALDNFQQTDHPLLNPKLEHLYPQKRDPFVPRFFGNSKTLVTKHTYRSPGAYYNTLGDVLKSLPPPRNANEGQIHYVDRFRHDTLLLLVHARVYLSKGLTRVNPDGGITASATFGAASIVWGPRVDRNNKQTVKTSVGFPLLLESERTVLLRAVLGGLKHRDWGGMGYKKVVVVHHDDRLALCMADPSIVDTTGGREGQFLADLQQVLRSMEEGGEGEGVKVEFFQANWEDEMEPLGMGEIVAAAELPTRVRKGLVKLRGDDEFVFGGRLWGWSEEKEEWEEGDLPFIH